MENNERPVMNEIEKEFKVQKIKKYEEMTDEIEKSNISRIVMLGIFAVVSMFCAGMTVYDVASNNFITAVVQLIASFVNGVVTSKLLYSLLDGISIKTSLQTNLNMLKDELELNDALEEEKAKTKTL